ncbi:MAG: phosphoribosylformylglycinamidine cyclo-ligase [Rickettsiaceae bacterium H1]|nr:phosphoribosylformylglycinamidine cyclo-ligase [Rickettsiaceae bacterium H1]
MKKNAYAQAGVDIEKGNELTNEIKPLAQNTYRQEVLGNIGGFGSLFSLDTKKYRNPILVSGTDGVGTKLMIAQATDNHTYIGKDLVGMCVNDVLCQGAEPLFFLDYFAVNKLDISVTKKVISGMAEACKEANVSLIGGETAEMPGMYEGNKYDLAGFCVGVVERNNILPKKNIEAGDIIIGLKSNGLHSNGFSLVRNILQKLKINLHDLSPWGQNSWLEILLQPTRIYVKPVLSIIKHVKGLAHITGGGMIENIPRILPKNLTFSLEYDDWPEIFLWLQKEGKITTKEMLTVFNCGIGMAIVVARNEFDNVMTKLKDLKVDAEKIGYMSIFEL